MGLFAFEEHTSLTLGSHAMDLARIPGCNVEIAVGREHHGPYVLLLRIVENFGFGIGIPWMGEAVYLAIRGCRHIYTILTIKYDGMDFQRVEVGNLTAPSIWIHAEQPRSGTAARINNTV